MPLFFGYRSSMLTRKGEKQIKHEYEKMGKKRMEEEEREEKTKIKLFVQQFNDYENKLDDLLGKKTETGLSVEKRELLTKDYSRVGKRDTSKVWWKELADKRCEIEFGYEQGDVWILECLCKNHKIGLEDTWVKKVAKPMNIYHEYLLSKEQKELWKKQIDNKYGAGVNLKLYSIETTLKKLEKGGLPERIKKAFNAIEEMKGLAGKEVSKNYWENKAIEALVPIADLDKTWHEYDCLQKKCSNNFMKLNDKYFYLKFLKDLLNML